MTPFGIVLVTAAVLSSQVMQVITQPKKYRCISLRPLPQPESEPISPWTLRLPPSLSATKTPSTASKSPASISKSPSSISKSQTSVPKSSSSTTKSSSTVQKVTSLVNNSSRTASRSPPDSFSLFKLPLQLISSLLVPLIPPTIRQNTSAIISPQFNFQMPLTFSTVHNPNYLPHNINNSPVPCNSLPSNTNNLPIPFNSVPCITNNVPIPFNSQPVNINALPTPCNTVPGNINILPNPCNTVPAGNINILPNPCNSVPGNINASTNPCNSVSGCTNHNNSLPANCISTLPNRCNSSAADIPGIAINSNNVFCNSLLGSSHKSIIYNWFCNYLLYKIQNVTSNIPTIEIIPTSSEPTTSATDNPTPPTPTTPIPGDLTVTSTAGYPPTEGTPNDDNTTPNDDNTPSTPNDNNTPNDTTPNDNKPTSTPHYPIPPCTLKPTCKIHNKPCLPLIHIPKIKPCNLPLSHSHSHTPLKCNPPNHASCSPSYPTTYKSNADDHTLNSQNEEILLKILKSLISDSNSRSLSTSK